MRNPTLGRHARNAQRAAHPELWRGCTGMWTPALGVQGAELFDVSGNGNNSTLMNINPETAWVRGKKGPELEFNGVNNYVDIPGINGTVFDVTDGWTLSFWLKYQGGGSGNFNHPISLNMWSQIPSINIYIDKNDRGATIGIRDDSGTSISQSDYSIFAVDTWFHTVITMRPGGILNVYENAAEVLNKTNASFGNITAPTSLKLMAEHGGQDHVLGSIGFISTYSRALTLPEIRQMYKDPLSPYRLRQTPPMFVSNAGPILKAIAETATSSETLQIAVALGLNELASSTEAPGITSALPLSESGAGLEGLSVTGSGQISVGDSGSAIETIDLIAALSLPDLGTGSDIIDIAAQVAIVESGGGSDTVNLSVILPITEIANGLDTLSLLAQIAQADTGSATDSITSDTGATLINITDVTTGIETLTISAILNIPESGAALEALLVNTGIVAQIIRMAAIAMSAPRMANVAMSVPTMANVVLTV